ncbi:hypothetical protein SKAU_G00096560 [Synaphobranchus kaupii]|uniref:Uncharacterized protein n=1 Tax=Synaphobranchus kaupii TaxID=118154 RepID=A0A9Q1FYK4_SYNKA|nr:hypothetical protein SKAU_G00096560 [Synaphobranchus kaupii]
METVTWKPRTLHDSVLLLLQISVRWSPRFGSLKVTHQRTILPARELKMLADAVRRRRQALTGTPDKAKGMSGWKYEDGRVSLSSLIFLYLACPTTHVPQKLLPT